MSLHHQHSSTLDPFSTKSPDLQPLVRVSCEITWLYKYSSYPGTSCLLLNFVLQYVGLSIKAGPNYPRPQATSCFNLAAVEKAWVASFQQLSWRNKCTATNRPPRTVSETTGNEIPARPYTLPLFLKHSSCWENYMFPATQVGLLPIFSTAAR